VVAKCCIKLCQSRSIHIIIDHNIADDEDKCLLPKGSNRMLIEFKTPIEAGGDLIFKPGVISSAAEHHTDDQLVEKLTGSVTVTNDDTEEKVE
jgi:hypothetical protein